MTVIATPESEALAGNQSSADYALAISHNRCMRWVISMYSASAAGLHEPQGVQAMFDYTRRSFGTDGKLNAVDAFMCIDQIVFVDAIGKQNSHLNRAASGLAGDGLSMPP